MKQTRITRTSRTSRRPAPESTSPLPVTPASSTTAAGALIGRIDRVLNER
ncbi:MAG TPA: hypothetical protein VNA14_08115 [Mycobacteriales bacterium]|nr:hypothetical protein [Mycobacteriales bacterium]